MVRIHKVERTAMGGIHFEVGDDCSFDLRHQVLVSDHYYKDEVIHVLNASLYISNLTKEDINRIYGKWDNLRLVTTDHTGNALYMDGALVAQLVPTDQCEMRAHKALVKMMEGHTQENTPL